MGKRVSIVTQDIRLPWERQSGEPDLQWKAFNEFKHMGHDRNLHEVAKIMDRKVTTIRKWSCKWGWQPRIELWDNEILKKETKAELEAIEEMRKRQAKQGMMAAGLGTLSVNKYLKLENASEKPVLKPVEALSFIEKGVQIERQARGEPEKIEMSGPGGGPVQQELTVRFVTPKNILKE